MPLFTEVICTWDNQQHALHSLNISESGMLLQPSLDAAIGSEVSLAFKIAEVRASLSLRARIIRKEGNERVAFEFIELAPEDRNAIQVYVTGHLTEVTRRRDVVGLRSAEGVSSLKLSPSLAASWNGARPIVHSATAQSVAFTPAKSPILRFIAELPAMTQ